MADASSIRSNKVNPSATGRNRGSIRFNTTTNIPVYSDGSNWNNFKNPQISQATISHQTATAAVNTVFYIATQPVRVKNVRQVHAVNSTSGKLQVVKLTPGQAIASGLNLLTSTIDLSTGAKTMNTGTLISSASDLLLVPGDRLAVVYTGTLTSLTKNVVTVEVESVTKRRTLCQPILTAATETLFTAPVPCVVTGFKLAYSTAGTNASAVTMTLTKDTSTNAPGAGTAISNALSLKSTINTPITATLVSGSTTNERLLVLMPGDRVAVLLTGTATAVAGLVTALEVKPFGQALDFVTLSYPAAGANYTPADTEVFVASQACKLLYISGTYSTANGGAAVATFEKEADGGTVGAGAAVTNSSTVDINTTVNTVQPLTMNSDPTTTTVLNVADRLNIGYSSAPSGVAGLHYTVGYQYILV